MYVLNQDFITENFCINKDKPELKCKGKCHMKDMLAQTAEQESEDSKILLEVMIPVFLCEIMLDLPQPALHKKQQFTVDHVLRDTYESWVFQPPRV